ncbi:hypothetical protein KUCAC02_033514, partial [Chaenocephalus aceratus]
STWRRRGEGRTGGMWNRRVQMGPPGPTGPRAEQSPSPTLHWREWSEGFPWRPGSGGDVWIERRAGLGGASGPREIAAWGSRSKGDKGNQGRHGAPGLTGVGDAGTPGPSGPPGMQGSAGAPVRTSRIPDPAEGARGYEGLKGSRGLPGVGSQGDKGHSGAPGASGMIGFPGAGIQGEKGDFGPSDLRAPEGLLDWGSWVQRGSRSWGTAGIPGIPGEDGAVGSKGEMGWPGVRGLEGAVGKGIHGEKGDGGDEALGASQVPPDPSDLQEQRHGDLGPVGPSGAVGEHGLGIIGPKGHRGNDGPVGPAGLKGDSSPGPQARGNTHHTLAILRLKQKVGLDYRDFQERWDQKGKDYLELRATEVRRGYQDRPALLGLDGSPGQSGASGLTGPPGEGLQGPKGEPGFKGPAGPRGFQGTEHQGQRLATRSDVGRNLVLFFQGEPGASGEPGLTRQEVILIVREICGCGLKCRRSALELVFVVDSSESVGPENFELVKDFVIALIDRVTVSQEAGRIGVVLFSHVEMVVVSLQPIASQDEIKAAVRNMPYLGEGTFTGSAIHRANQLFQVSRPGVRKVAVVLTDGQADPRDLMQFEENGSGGP